MAGSLNIGNLNFGVDADTKGLKKAIQELGKFRAVTTRLAQSQSKDAQKLISMRSRQESATKKAFQATLKLQQELKKSGASAQRIGSVTAAFNKLTKEMTSGNLTMLQFTRSQDAFAARMGRSRRELVKMRSSMLKGKEGSNSLVGAFRNLETSAVLAIGPLSGLGSRIRAIGVLASRGQGLTFWKIALLATVASVVVATIAFAKLLGAMVSTAREFETFQARFEFATGSVKLGAREMNFVIQTSIKLGLEIKTLGRAYSRLTAASKGTRSEGNATREVFLSLAHAAAAMRLSNEEVEGAFRAVEQIMSKGSVQAEELRGQLGERIPGAFRLAAASVGKTTKELGEMLKAGELLSDDFLINFARFLREDIGDAGTKAVGSLTGATNNLSTAWTLMLRRWDEAIGVSDTWTLAVLQATTAIRLMGGHIDDAAVEIDEFGRAIGEANTAMEEMPTKIFDNFAKTLKDVNDEATILRGALGSVGAGFFKSIEEATDAWVAFQSLAGATQPDLNAAAQDLAILLKTGVEGNLLSIIEAYVELRKVNRQLAADTKREMDTGGILGGIDQEMADMTGNIAALKVGGKAGADVFKDFNKPLTDLQTLLNATNLDMEARNVIETAWIALKTEELALIKQGKTGVTADKKAARDRERFAVALQRGAAATKRLRAETEALMKGTNGLKAYEKVIENLLRYRELLERSGDDELKIVAALKERRDALVALANVQDNVNAAAFQASTGIINSMEAIILKTKDVGDALRDLARELLRVFLRATFLDPLLAGLTGGLSDLFRKKGIGTQGGGITGSGSKLSVPIPGPTKKAAYGLNFRVPGSGGSDNKQFNIAAKSGEQIIVRRPSQNGRSDGGGITIVINAPGADAGTVARIKEMVQTEIVPQVIVASTSRTLATLRRPRFA